MKEKMVILSVLVNKMAIEQGEHLNHPVFKSVSSVAQELGQPAFVIGGYVRDLILQRQSKDIDIVTLGSGIELAQKVAALLGSKKIQIFRTLARR